MTGHRDDLLIEGHGWSLATSAGVALLSCTIAMVLLAALAVCGVYAFEWICAHGAVSR